MRNLILSSTAIMLVFTTNGQILVSDEVFTAIQFAQSKDVDLKNNRLGLEKSNLETKSVWNKYLPKVAVTGAYAYLDNEITVDIPTQTLPIINQEIFAGEQQLDANANIAHAGITAKTVLFSGGQIYNGAKALEYKHQGTELMMSLKEDEVARMILESFDHLSLIHKAEAFIEESYIRLEKEQLRIEKAVENGLAIPYDRERIKLATLELDSKKKDLENKKQLLAYKLEQETGMSKEQILQSSHHTDPIAIVEQLAVNERAELKALSSFQKAADYKIKKEQGAYLPTLGAFAGYAYTSVFNAHTSTTLPNLDNRTLDFKLNQFTIHPNFMAGVVLKWELFAGFETRHKVAEARIAKNQIDNKLIDAKEKLDLQMQKCQMTYANMNDQLSIAKQRALVAANNLHLSEKQYQSGLININDRLAAENQLFSEQLFLEETILKQRKAAMDLIQASHPLSDALTIIK